MSNYDQDTTSIEDLDSEYGTSYEDPSVSGPNLILGTGVGGDFTSATTLSGSTATGWNEVQWGAPGYFQPSSFSTNHVDSLLGSADGYWNVGSDGNSSEFAVYGSKGNYVYQMGGKDTSNYENNIFIQTNNALNYNFSHQITFTANEGLTNVSGSGNAYMVDNAFTVEYKNGSFVRDFFLQVQISDSRGEPSAYSTITTPSNGQFIYNVTETAGSTGNTTSVEYLPWQNDTSLHTVTINVNEALLALAKSFVNSGTGQSSSDILNMNNWTLGGSYIGVEIGQGDGADFDVQNPEYHYDTSSTFTSSDDNKQVVSIQGVGYQDIKYNVSTLNNTDTNVVIDGNKDVFYSGLTKSTPSYQNITLNGYWDTVDLNSHTLVATVNTGSSFTSDNGNLTESGSGNIYVAGSYAGLNLTLTGTSSVNAVLNGTGNITSANNNIEIVGENTSSLILSGNGFQTLDGIFSKGLTDNTISSGNIYSEIGGTSSVNNNGGNVNLTVDGNLTYQNNSGESSLLGNNAGTLNITGNNSGYINGSWKTISGTINGDMNVTTDNLDITNNGDIEVVGNGGSLNYSGNGKAGLFGEWSNVTATIQDNQDFNSIVGSNTNMTLDSGSQSAIWNQSGNGVNILANGGNSLITLGSGYTNISVDMDSNAVINIKDFSTSHSELLLNHLQNENLSITQSGANTIIQDTGLSGKIVLEGIDHNTISSLSSVGNTVFSQQDGSTTLAII